MARSRLEKIAINDVFDFTDPLRMWLVIFGTVGQAVFFCRWIIQWLASEKRGESHMPVAFWW